MENIGKSSDCPRVEALRLMAESLSLEESERNTKYVGRLKDAIAANSLNHHEILSFLYSGDLSLSDLQTIHLEYREAIVRVFTDALSVAIFNARQLEPRLSPGSKMAARSLLTLNCLDEFGFKVGVNSSNYFVGTPADAHYPLFEKVLAQLDLKPEVIESYRPSASAVKLKDFLESSYHSYSLVLALLAVAEAQVITFSPALRAAVSSLGLDVTSGYYHVHGVSSDEDCDASDDDHEDDLWSALVQAVTRDEYKVVEESVSTYLILWDEFWNDRLESIKTNLKPSNQFILS
tara:strand:+ start:5684 stop:6556 length:873 start_codon:yes stop_codon:yes gene_type:complete